MSSNPTPQPGIILYSGLLTTLLLLLLFLITGIPGGVPDGADEDRQPKPSTASRSAMENALRGKVIVVDPGHGGSIRGRGDHGTEGVGPAPEKENVLATSLYLRDMLERAGAKVVMTRIADVSPADGTRHERGGVQGQLLARIEIAHAADADVFVSVHNDWHSNPSISGTTTYYHGPQDIPLAQAIQDATYRALNFKDRGIHFGNFRVLRDTAMPSVLVEVGYLSNYHEAHLLATEEYRRKAAQGIYDGLVQYFHGKQ